MATENLPPAYIRVRDQLMEDGYDEMMRNQAEVRSTLHGMLIAAEELERRYRDLLSKLDDADDEANH